MKSLVVVESPAKAKTIGKYLGNDYKVMASVGHVMDLPPQRMGVDLDAKEILPEYVPIAGKSQIIKEIKAAAKKSDVVYLALDPDREGEAIAFHLAGVIGNHFDEGRLVHGIPNDPHIHRVRFHEITKKTIQEAFSHPDKLNYDLFDAQQARRVLDRVVGYKISPILWKKVRRGLSAGRVQSVAVRMIADREAEVAKFVSKEYWTVEAQAQAKKPPLFSCNLVQIDGKKAEITNSEQAQQIKNDLEKASPVVEKVVRKPRTRNPIPAFVTSKLQQDSARAFRFNPKKTMRIAQGLYEGVELGEEGAVGLITYMRTDSTKVGPEAIADVRQYILETYGAKYLPEKPNVFKSKKAAQEAHEAIRPTSIKYPPEKIKQFLTAEQLKLYKLIWDRFVASQMPPATYDQTTIEIAASKYVLRATGSEPVFDGFLKVYKEQLDEDDSKAKDQEKEEKTLLPKVTQGESIVFKSVVPAQHFTQPPPRFNEASFIKELEERGIGRPSTYTSILSTIEEKGYVEKVEGRLHPSELGVEVNTLLLQSFPDIMNVEFTAELEEKLDKIEEGEADWKRILSEFYVPFKLALESAQENMPNIKRMEEPTDIPCEKCGKLMVIKWGKNGRFLGCPGYPECKNTKPIVLRGSEVVVVQNDEVDIKCQKCGSPMVWKHGKSGRFLGCSTYPACNFTMSEPTNISCPKNCGGTVVVRKSKKGRTFYGCGNYPKCDFVSWNKPVNQKCQYCSSPYVEEKISRGQVTLLCPECKTPQ